MGFLLPGGDSLTAIRSGQPFRLAVGGPDLIEEFSELLGEDVTKLSDEQIQALDEAVEAAF